MKKRVKILFCMLCSMIVILTGSFSSQASERLDLAIPNQTKMQSVGDEEISPAAHEVCAGLPYHDMRSRGWGTVYKNGEYYIKSGACWQCVNCYTVMVTEGDIWYGQMQTIGKYATLPWGEPITYTGCVIETAAYYGQTSSNSLSGYRFGIN